jgi:hypothetical protein
MRKPWRSRKIAIEKDKMTRISLVLRSPGDERTVRSLREITENEKLSLGYHRPSIVVFRLPTMAQTKSLVCSGGLEISALRKSLSP